MATYPSWGAARAAWIADKATPRRYRFPCPGCARPMDAPHDTMAALSDRGGLCPACETAERAMYRATTRDDLLHEG